MVETLADTRGTREATGRSAAAGDEAAFARLVAEHHPSMARVAFVICGDAATTEDVLQSAWTIAWRRLESLRDPARVRSWLVAIAANEARQAIRRRHRERIVDISDEIASAGSDVDHSVAVLDLYRAIRDLSPEDRSLLAMRFAAGLDSTEIAEQIRVSPSGVRSRISRIIERLRVDLEATEADR